jgi:EpsD family peptidyl-prolyl cis-trans isomerase
MLRTFTKFPALAIVAALSACGGADQATEPSQVVARVDGAEITVSQLRAALMGKGDPAATPDTTQQALEGLVNEQLLVGAALRNKLDRDPVVMQAFENARRQLLARAYLERSVFPKGEISAADQNAYYKGHPALFAQREIYQVTTFTLPSAQLPEPLMKDLDAATSTEAVAAALAAHKMVAETQTLTRAAEQLPLEQLQAFAAAEVGDAVIQASPGGGTMLTVITGIQSSPIGFESAQPIIQQYLANMRNAEALDAHLRQARGVASITHFEASLAAQTSPSAMPAAEPRDASAARGAAVLN